MDGWAGAYKHRWAGGVEGRGRLTKVQSSLALLPPHPASHPKPPTPMSNNEGWVHEQIQGAPLGLAVGVWGEGGVRTEPHRSCQPLLPQPVHSTRSQLDTPSRMMSRCWSILHSAYMVRTALMASLCAGPVPPLRASSRLRQMHVARFRRFESGVPNQYLPASQPLLDPVSRRGRGTRYQTTKQERKEGWADG